MARTEEQERQPLIQAGQIPPATALLNVATELPQLAQQIPHALNDIVTNGIGGVIFRDLEAGS
jgi:hypothetical protein